MTNPTNPSRIEGEFHYAELITWKPSQRQSWVIRRRDDNKPIPRQHDRKDEARMAVGAADEQARHFITLGRKQMADEVNAAAQINARAFADPAATIKAGGFFVNEFEGVWAVEVNEHEIADVDSGNCDSFLQALCARANSILNTSKGGGEDAD